MGCPFEKTYDTMPEVTFRLIEEIINEGLEITCHQRLKPLVPWIAISRSYL